MPFPEKIVDRENYIYSQVLAGNFEAEWTPLEFTRDEMTVRINVMKDALKIDGVRVNVSAELQQKLADVFDASFLTAQIADLMFLRADHRIEPCPFTISSTVAAMIKHSAAVDSKIGQKPTGLVAPAGKHWILDRKLDYNSSKACNYGWHFLGKAYRGIKGYPVASSLNSLNGTSVSVIQPNACAHDIRHSDYSQICQLAAQDCWVDGAPHRLSNLLQDPVKCSLVVHGGPLIYTRQPKTNPITGTVVFSPVKV